jgi:hypothetical protein
MGTLSADQKLRHIFADNAFGRQGNRPYVFWMTRVERFNHNPIIETEPDSPKEISARVQTSMAPVGCQACF